MKSLVTLTTQTDQERNRINLFLGLQLQVAVFMSMAGVGGGTSSGDASSGSRQLLWGAMAMFSLAYIVIRSLAGRQLRISFGGWPIAIMLIYVSSSAWWSVDAALTVKRAVLLLILVVVCSVSVGLESYASCKNMFSKLIAKPMILLLGLSVLVTLLAPGRAFSDIGWRGIANHKNEAGQMMAFATVLFLYGACHKKLDRKTRIGLATLSFAGLVMAKSTTALLGLIVGVGITELIMLRPTVRQLGTWKIIFVGTLLSVSMIFFLAFQLDLLPSVEVLYSKTFEILGKSETFTGRTAIWEIVLGESRFHNPWIGGGYGAFWAGRESISGYVIMGDNLYPGQSHNGYVDIYNELGYVGAAILVILITIGLARAGRLLLANHPEGRLHLAIILLCTFLNLGESTFLRTTAFMNIIFIASFVRATALLRVQKKSTNQN